MRFSILALILLLAACGGGNDDDDDGRTTNESNQAVATATETESSEPAEGSTATETPEATSTTEPTATEAPTATPSPTDTPEPTATPTEPPAEPDLQVGKWRMDQNQFGSSTTIVGEVLNQGEGDAQRPQVIITLLDGAGAVVASNEASQILPFVPTQGKSPFRATFLETDAASVADVQFQVQFERYDESSFYAKNYTTSFETIQIQWGEGSITGQIENVGQQDASLVSVMVIGYTTEGEIFGVERTYIDFDVFAAGMIAPFTINLFGDQYEGTPATVEVYADGFVED